VYNIEWQAMQINQTRIEPDVTVIAPVGRLTLGRETQAFESAMTELVTKGERKLVLDLKQLDYIDSAGLGVILASASRAREAEGMVRLANVGTRVMQVLKLTRTDAVLPIDPSVNDSVANF
jgi:anti-sigma B factor antagonist